MRCFVAVDLAPELRKKVEALQKELAGLNTKLVEPENLHFTLKFLGEVDEDIVNKIRYILKDVAGSHMQFFTEIAGVGVFPNDKFIRVVWLGEGQKDIYDNKPSLINLQSIVNEALSGLFNKEKSSSHLTLARVRSQTYREEIIKFLNRHKSINAGTMKVNCIKLKKSVVTSKGPVYEDVDVFELGHDNRRKAC